jgi:hypothetical protein
VINGQVENIQEYCEWHNKREKLGVRTFFLDLTTRLGQDFVDILSGS